MRRAQRGEQVERTMRVSAVFWCLLTAIACDGGGDQALLDDGAAPETLVMRIGGLLRERPVAPLKIDGACPFECCTYGDWTATEETTVYAEPDPRSPQRTLPAGTGLEAISGFVVLTEIGVAIARDSVRMYTEDGAERLAAAGDTLFILDNVGEGFRRVWHEGRVLQTDAASGLVPVGVPAAEVLVEPRQEWWARVRTPDGGTGWLWMDRTPRMEGADACG